MYQHEKETSWLGHGRPANSSAKAAHKHSPAAVGASAVTAALGPGSLLQLLQGVKHGPSFVPKTSSSTMPSMAGCVTGSVIRHGPDGRGSTAAFLASNSETTKRVRMKTAYRMYLQDHKPAQVADARHEQPAPVLCPGLFTLD
jgi:hypothetical protein